MPLLGSPAREVILRGALVGLADRLEEPAGHSMEEGPLAAQRTNFNSWKKQHWAPTHKWWDTS